MPWRIVLPGGLLLVGLLVVVGYVTSSTSASGQRLLGDVDCNQQVNSVDAALILQVDAGLLVGLQCGDAADVSQDGATNAVDAALILQFDAGLLEGLGKVLSVPTLASSATPPPTAGPEDTATPPATMLPEVTATPPPTAAPNPTYLELPECSEWPPEIANMLERLSVQEGLCLIVFAEPPPNLNCTGAAFYVILAMICCVVDCSGTVQGTFLYHEVCHSHQVRVVQDKGIPVTNGDEWASAYPQLTSEGVDFVERTGWQLKDGDMD